MELPQYFYWIQLILGIFTLSYLLKSKNQLQRAVGTTEKKFIARMLISGLILFVTGIFFVDDYSLSNIYTVFIVTLTMVWAVAALYILVRRWKSI
ncbi:hypothetical protein H1R16_11040 [Marnyiella aurantia]|uniref:DUF3325 domain-containing protein n=1 Tax=Marnyiella aurantia TaxID=2758037 RepID=A0A7D7QEI1_9FLAO|nr:hypothetical protein [Marnyiella aurantia]MBA5246411.1 hypothetical protein [Marnyiella aurantia]QMS98221.1 hypothetical protein H1R16_11040 [Marnyiella aurantia]